MLFPFTFVQFVDALILLCQIDQIKIGRERRGDYARRIDIQRFDLCRELPRRIRLTSPAVFRRNTDAFLRFEEFARLKLADHAAENITQ